jgi:hypothetical protein
MSGSNEGAPIPKATWPTLLNRYVEEKMPISHDYYPRQARRRFHSQEMVLWQGLVNVKDIEGYVENLRLKFYLNRWKTLRGNSDLDPSTEDIYQIMLEADREESYELKKPFHVERMAQSIARNGVQEPIVVYTRGEGKGELWDGNRRFFGTLHILKDHKFPDEVREQAQWIPALVVSTTGLEAEDLRAKHNIITELNFVEKDHIPWPAYIKAEQIFDGFKRLTAADPTDPLLSRSAKERLAKEYGLKGSRVADRWIKMYDLAMQFKEYHEEEHNRPSTDVDLKIQERFEYFDEMSKPGVWGVLKSDPDARDEVFRWLWDDKFKAFPDVRSVPKILSDPVARRIANADDVDAVKRAIQTVIANDPTRVKDKEAANEKIAQFAEWLDSFKREDFRQLDLESLAKLKVILEDVTKLLAGLLSASSERRETTD